MKIVKSILSSSLLGVLFAVAPAVHAQTTAFGIDASGFPTLMFSSVPIPGATPITPVGATAAGGQGGDFGPDSLFYGTSNNALVTISLTDGSISTIGTITGVAGGQSIIGMGFDLASGTMYLATTDLTNTGSDLYTLDLATAAATRVGAITNATSVLAIAVNSAGDIFAFDDGADNFMTVDPATGAGTVVGPLTITPFAQDADFDAKTGTLYWTFFDGTSGRLSTVDASTGVATDVTSWSADFIAFAILGDGTATSVAAHAGAGPSQISLAQNYPNPFNPETMIRYELKENTGIELAIYNLLGQRVRVLVKGSQAAGEHQVRWNGVDDFGQLVSSGVYVYRLTTNNRTESRKMLLLQ